MGLGSELKTNVKEKWADYDRAEQEHIENIKGTEHPDRFNTPDGYFKFKRC